MEKKFIIDESELKELVEPMGYCFASDKITVEGMQVGFMFRETPQDKEDSGWRFFSGTEEEDYLDNPDNLEAFEVNTIANLDPAIIPYLNSPYETDLDRTNGSDIFEVITE